MKNTSEINRRKLIETLTWLVFFMVLAGSISKFIVLETTRPPWVGLIIAAISATTGFYVRSGGSSTKAVWVIITSVYVGFVVSAFYTGAFDGPIVYLAPMLPVLSVLLLDRKAGWVGFGITLIALSILSLLQYYGLANTILLDDTDILFSKYFVVSISCLVTTWIVWDFARKSNEFAEANLRSATTDFLTGIANRRKIENSLELEIERARRSDSGMSLILIDVDHFKRYNDSNGHQAGDKCLVIVAQVISSCAKRSIDLVGRYGGEEFIVILPNTDASAACDIAEKMRSEMQSKKIPYEPESKDHVSLTFGVASMKGHAAKSVDRLVKFADNALYYGKANGRNSIVNAIFDAQSELTRFECQ